MDLFNAIMNFAEEPESPKTNTPQISQPVAITLIVVGIIVLAAAIGLLIFYIKNSKQKALKANREFKTTPKQARYDVYKFWTNYVYIFLVVVGFVAFIILEIIGIGALF